MANTFLGLQSIAALLLDEDQYIEWIVQQMIARGGITFFVARPGAGKSLLAYYITACVLTGSPIFDAVPVQQGAVAYIDLDGRKSIARMRAIAALRGLGLDDTEIADLPLYIAAQRSSADLRDPIVLRAVLDELATIPNLILVVLDTYSDLHHGKEGNPDDMTDTVSGMAEIATAFNCGVLVIHHARKNGGNELEDVRGASSIVAKADAVFLLKTEREDEDNPGKLTLLQRKARLTEEARPRSLTLEANGEVDGTLHAYRFALADDADGKRGRPPAASTAAGQQAVRLLREHPGLSKAELVKRLIDAGIKRTVAYEVAGEMLSGNIPDLGVMPFSGQSSSLDTQGKTHPETSQMAGMSGDIFRTDSAADESVHKNGALPQPVPASRFKVGEDDDREEFEI